MVWIRFAKSKLVITVALTSFAVMFITITGCGSDEPVVEGDAQIRTAPADYTIEDLKAFGLKTSKQYDVEDLPDGLDAWKGFWGLDPYDRHDYEIRFYASHELAVSSGKPLAIESTGAEFLANRDTSESLVASGEGSAFRTFKDNQTWEEGVKERWQAKPLGAVGPTYPNWMILGNMVILCDGLDSEEALARCAELIDSFVPSEEG
ncbi:MAG TPA: hypothetical protein QF694_03840 [Dehalococcoidia bacterium]|nr:hypothetical protein [Dehalococcoidia bacterium]